jgi:hypothetical protein
MNTLKNINEKEKNLWQRFRLSALKKKKSICPGYNVLAAYLENKASKREVREVEEHLAFCSECYKALKELRILRKEKVLEPPIEVIERAKALVNTPIAKKKQLVVGLPLWVKNPFLYAKYSFGLIAVLALFAIACITGLHFGKNTFYNHNRVSIKYISEISFGLGDNSGSGLGYSDSRINRR